MISSPLWSTRLLAVALAAGLVLGLGACGSSDDDGGAAKATSTATDPAAALVQSGLDQIGSGQGDAAEVTFENVLAIDPQNLYALYNLGYLAQRAKDDASALDYYDKALDVQADYEPALYNKAILTESTDLDAAVAIYQQIIKKDPKMAASYMRLGFALIHQGQVQEGKADLKQGVELDPSMAKVESPTYP